MLTRFLRTIVSDAWVLESWFQPVPSVLSDHAVGIVPWSQAGSHACLGLRSRLTQLGCLPATCVPLVGE